MTTPRIGIYGPYDASSYPFLSILTSIFIMIFEIELPYAATLMTVIIGTVTFLVVFVFIRSLTEKGDWGDSIVALSALLYATSPDAVAQGLVFYHRQLTLIFAFIILYLVFIRVFKCREPRYSFSILLITLFAILPMTYSAYPSIYIVSIFTLIAMLYMTEGVSRLLVKNGDLLKGVEIRPLFRVSLIALSCSFIWYFNAIYPSTLVYAFRHFIQGLIFPEYKVLELYKFEKAAFPPELRPEPFVHLLMVRDLLLWIPALASLGVLAYEFLFKSKKEVIFPLFATVSFAPMFLGSYLSGYVGALEIRYYAMPLIIFLAAYAYTLLLKVGGRAAKVSTALVLAFLVAMAFLAPYTHVYFPRYIYDPSISFKEVGVAEPQYIHLKNFLKEHELSNGLILSDAEHLLTIILDLNQWNYVKPLSENFGKRNTYILEFIYLKPPVGYRSPEVFERMAELRANVASDYCKVVDGGNAYSIYYKP